MQSDERLDAQADRASSGWAVAVPVPRTVIVAIYRSFRPEASLTETGTSKTPPERWFSSKASKRSRISR